MDPTVDDKQSYFSAARPTVDLGMELAGLEMMRRLIFGPQPRKQFAPLPFGANPYSPVMRSMQLQQRISPEELANPPAKLPNRAIMMHPINVTQNDRKDLLNDIEGTIYGGGNVPPPPTPTPTPPRYYAT